MTMREPRCRSAAITQLIDGARNFARNREKAAWGAWLARGAQRESGKKGAGRGRITQAVIYRRTRGGPVKAVGLLAGNVIYLPFHGA